MTNLIIKKSKERGITLIALVIIIIVLLIIAGVTIAALSGDNSASQKDAIAGAKDENGGIKWGDRVATTGKTGNTAKKLSDTDTTETWSVESFGNLTDDLKLPKGKNIIAKKGTEEEEQQVVIPAGFKQATDSADTLEGGIVIEDASGDSTKQGNQFVWVPVNQKLAFQGQKEESGTIELGRYDFGTTSNRKLDGPKDGSANIFLTGSSSSKTTEDSKSVARNIREFVAQTEDAKGYYIGRYEMGQGGVCKANQTVYNNVTRNQAVTASQNLYNDVKKGETIIYTSDLINSYAWDTAIVYIMKTTGDDYAYQVDGEGSSAVATGTKGDEKCKIHDMAKNVYEWTTEFSSNIDGPSVFRGDDFDDGSYGYTSYRNDGSTSGSYPDVGFRPILYIVGLNA